VCQGRRIADSGPEQSAAAEAAIQVAFRILTHCCAVTLFQQWRAQPQLSSYWPRTGEFCCLDVQQKLTDSSKILSKAAALAPDLNLACWRFRAKNQPFTGLAIALYSCTNARRTFSILSRLARVHHYATVVGSNVPYFACESRTDLLDYSRGEPIAASPESATAEPYCQDSSLIRARLSS
jgi:hypothetical protein